MGCGAIKTRHSSKRYTSMTPTTKATTRMWNLCPKEQPVAGETVSGGDRVSTWTSWRAESKAATSVAVVEAEVHGVGSLVVVVVVLLLLLLVRSGERAGS